MESILIFAVVILGLSGAVLAVIFGAILSWDWNLIVVAASVASAISYCLNIFMIHRILRVPSNPSETQKLVIGTLNLMFSAPFGFFLLLSITCNEIIFFVLPGLIFTSLILSKIWRGASKEEPEPKHFNGALSVN